jgi:hypothetical protein
MQVAYYSQRSGDAVCLDDHKNKERDPLHHPQQAPTATEVRTGLWVVDEPSAEADSSDVVVAAQVPLPP